MVEFQGTPNPNAVKVLLPKPLVDGSLVVTKDEDAADHPVARDLFALEGVTELFFLQTFVTVNKEADLAWDDLLPGIERVVTEHLA